MTTEITRFALLIPAENADEISTLEQIDSNVELKTNVREYNRSSRELSFDLETARSLAWLTVELIGSGASAVGAGIIANHFYQKIKDYWQEPDNFVLRIRLPSGRIAELTEDDVGSIEELVKILKEG